MNNLIQKLKKIFGSEHFIVKFLFAVFLVLLTAASTVYSVKTIDWGYGYGYSTYGYRYIFADAPPSTTTSLATSSSSTSKIDLTWLAVTTTTKGTDLDSFASYKIYRATSSANANKTSGTLQTTITTKGSGTQSYTAQSLSAGTGYYFAIYTVDDLDNWSLISNVASAETSVATASSGGGGGGLVSVPVTQTPVVEEEAAVEEEATPESVAEEQQSSLIRMEGDYRIYVVENGKKRHIPSQKAFEDSGYNWNNVAVVAKGSFGSRETVSLVRARGDYKVYVLNENGYRRHVTSSEIFNYYSHLGWEKVVELSPFVMKSYKETKLVRATGDTKVYEIEGSVRRWLNITAEQFAASGRKWEAVHIINEMERNFYALD